jgi:hypothetical protein
MEQTIAHRFGPDDYIALSRASRSIGPLGRWGRAALFGLLIGGPAVAFSYEAPRRALPSADAFADLAGRVRTKVAARGAGQ